MVHHGPSHSPQVQLVPHGVVAVGEGPHLALLVRQVLAELVEVVLQRAARVLSRLQLAVQPQHAGLLLQQRPPLALGEEATQRDAPSRSRETPGLPCPCPQMLVQAVPPLLPGGHLSLTCSSLTLCCRAPGLAGMGASCARADSKPRMTLSASWICRSRPRAALALPQERSMVRRPLGHTQLPRPAAPTPEHSLLSVEAAEHLHVAVLVLDVVKDHGQVQGGGAHRLPGEKRLTLLLGRLLLSPQALQPLGGALGWGGAQDLCFGQVGSTQPSCQVHPTLPTKPERVVWTCWGSVPRDMTWGRPTSRTLGLLIYKTPDERMERDSVSRELPPALVFMSLSCSQNLSSPPCHSRSGHQALAPSTRGDFNPSFIGSSFIHSVSHWCPLCAMPCMAYLPGELDPQHP